MKSVFVVSTPFQYYSMYSILFDGNFSGKIDINILLSGNLRNNEQLIKVMNEYPINMDRLKFWHMTGKKNKILHLIKAFIHRENEQYELYLGDVRSRYMHLFLSKKCRRLISIDDGSSSIKVIDDIANGYTLSINGNESGWLKKIFFLLIKLSDKRIKDNLRKASFLTGFKTKPSNNVRRYKFYKREQSIDFDKKKTGTCFIGSKFTEFNYVSEDEMFKLIRQLSSKASSFDYIAHRGESEDKLTSISNLCGVNVKFLDYPIEIEYLSGRLNYFEYVSLFSTALMTLKEISKGDEVFSAYKFKDSSNFEKVSSIYKVMEVSYDINIYELEE